jgi:ankyrin repeat protein
VELQLRHFCDLKSKTSIDQAMSDPAGASIHTLNHLYAKIFDRIVRTDPLAYNVAAQVFRLMMCLHEAMPPATLIAAASITRDRVQYSLELSDLLRTCSYLVVLDDELDTLRFAHASVQEYLSSLPEFSITNANSTAAWSCLLRCTDNAAPDLTIGIQPARDFDVYATMYWPVHYNAASEHDRNGYLGDALREFMFSDEEFMSPFVSWIETVDEISKTLSISHKRFMDLAAIGSETATPLFTACIYGLEFAITTLSETSSFNVNQKNASGHTGLYLASAAGQIRVVDRLLKLGADVAIEGGRQTTALQVACANGHGDIAQVILDFSSPNLTAEAITSAVQAALRNDHEQVALVLLKDDRFPMSQDTFDQVFEAAAGMGFTELMDYLHLTPKSLNENKKFATRGAEKLFLDSKMKRFRNYFESRELPRDAIATAAFYGQNEIIEFCLGKGLDIEHEGPFGTPLRTASLMGHGTTVRLLLDRDAEINATGSFGDALQAAAMRGHLSVATTLIQSGVAVDNCAGYYGNALQAAVYRGHVDVVKALLAAGASISQKGLFSDALSAAVSAGNQPIADLLLRSGYRSQHLRDRDEIIPPPMYRMSPPPSHVDLLSALDITNRYELPQNENRVSAIQGRDLSFQEAYESIHNSSGANNAPEPPNFEQQERYGSQALLIATATGQDSVVRSMLDCRTTIGLSLFDIGVVLQAASSAGRLGIVDYILLLPESPRKVIPRSLERAAWYGHVAIMRRLLECKEAYGPPSDSRYGPFIPVGDEQCHFRYAHKLSHIGLSHKKESQWSDYFSLSYEEVEINETAENGHILRILLQGCRADEPATVNFALELAAGSGLQNLFAAALSIAIRCDSARVAEILFQYCPAIDTIAPKKTFAQAEEHGALSVLYFLLQRNSDHEYQLQDYWNVFDGAAIANHTELVSYLITQTLHCQESSLFERRFVEAAQGGYISAVEAWYEQLCKCAEHALVLSQALDQACANGHATVVSYLIERGIDVNTIVEKPVEPASLNDAEGSIREWRIYRQRWGLESDECIDGVTRVQAWPRTPLHACLQATPQRDRIKGVRNWEGLQNFRDVKNNFLTKQQAVVELLLRKGAKANIVDKYGRNALHYAALHCPVPTVQAILESGKTMNLLDKDKRTPMFYAAWREIDSLTILKALMKAEAQVPDPSAPHTPLPVTLDAALSVFREGFIESESVHQVLTTGPGAVVRYLLRSQLDLQATADGFTLLLQMASADGDIDLVQLLIERNVDFKAVAHYYGSALRAAAQFGHLDCVKLLVEAGSDVDSTEGKLGWTPLRSAVHGQHLAIVQYLLDLGVVQPIDYSTERVPTRFNDKCSALTFACCSGNLDLVRMLLLCSGRSSPLSAPPEKRRAQLVDISSALQGACAHGHSRIVALLIEYGADIEENSDDSESPLTIAASTGSLETMKVLLAAGATLYDAERVVNILRTVVENENPKEVIDYALLQLLGGDDFISACKEVPGYTRIWQEDTEFILNVDIMPTSERLLTNLAALGAQRSIELLLERPTDMVDVSTQVLQTAAYFQNYEVLFTLLPMVVMPQPLPTGYQSPIYALLEGLVAIGSKGETFHKISCCEIWDTDSFENYEDLSQPDEECTCGFSRATASDTIMKLAQINETHICTTVGTLHLAACLGMLQVVRTCLEAGVDINQHHSPFGSALIAAIRGGDLEVITLLLEHHIDVNATAGKLGTPLYLACEARNLELIQLMLQHGAFVDDATPTTGTALHMACQNEDREIAEILLQHGANVNVCIAEKGTPMHVACENNDEEMIRLLLTYGADVDAISPDLGAPLHTTCKSYSSGSAEILLEHGANINIFSHSHGTPLHAACNGSGSLYAPWRGPHGDTFLQLLVKHGADVNSKGSKGETPLTSLLSQDYGHGYGSERSVEALLNSEQQCDVTQNDMEQLLVKFGSMTPGIEFCKRVLEKYPHVQPTIEMIRQVLAGPGYQAGSEILRILLARASHLIVTPEILVLANNVQNLELLAQHGCGIKITADIMEAFTKPLQLELVRYCVRSAPDVRPPKAVTKAIRAILDEPKPNATQNFSKRRIGYAQRESKALPKEIMELILARHPDVEGLPSTTAPNKTQKSDYDS